MRRLGRPARPGSASRPPAGPTAVECQAVEHFGQFDRLAGLGRSGSASATSRTRFRMLAECPMLSQPSHLSAGRSSACSPGMPLPERAAHPRRPAPVLANDVFRVEPTMEVRACEASGGACLRGVRVRGEGAGEHGGNDTSILGIDVSSRYAFRMVTFCKNCGKVFVSVPQPRILSLRLLECQCGHSQIVTVWSVLDAPTGRRPYPWLPGAPTAALGREGQEPGPPFSAVVVKRPDGLAHGS